MKSFLLVAAALVLAGSVRAGEPEAIEGIIKTLHEAKGSAAPEPLLEKAKAELSKFEVAAPARSGETGHGKNAKRKMVMNEVDPKEVKDRAVHALDQAIDAAKTGSGEVTSKIDAAIAEVHRTGSLKH